MACLTLMAGCDQPPSSTVVKAKATQDPIAADVDRMEADIRIAAANKRIEELRTQGLVGSSLQSELSIAASGRTYKSLARLGDDLRFVMITSQASLQPELAEAELAVSASASSHQKCERCWHYRADVGADAAHPTICGRCVSNLFGQGEARTYA